LFFGGLGGCGGFRVELGLEKGKESSSREGKEVRGLLTKIATRKGRGRSDLAVIKERKKKTGALRRGGGEKNEEGCVSTVLGDSGLRARKRTSAGGGAGRLRRGVLYLEEEGRRLSRAETSYGKKKRYRRADK